MQLGRFLQLKLRSQRNRKKSGGAQESRSRCLGSKGNSRFWLHVMIRRRNDREGPVQSDRLLGQIVAGYEFRGGQNGANPDSLNPADLKTESHHQGIFAAVLGLIIAAPHADLRKACRGIQPDRGHVGRPYLKKNDARTVATRRAQQMLQ